MENEKLTENVVTRMVIMLLVLILGLGCANKDKDKDEESACIKTKPFNAEEDISNSLSSVCFDNEFDAEYAKLDTACKTALPDATNADNVIVRSALLEATVTNAATVCTDSCIGTLATFWKKDTTTTYGAGEINCSEAFLDLCAAAGKICE